MRLEFAYSSHYKIQPQMSRDCPKNRLKRCQLTKTTIVG